MASSKTTLLSVLLALCELLCDVSGQCTASEYSIKQMTLQNHVFKEIKTSNAFECFFACRSDVRCQSFNYVITQDICQLNNRTKEARPADFVPSLTSYYYGRVQNRVTLGSIFELPAESCKEIKASEGEHATNGKYWFDSIKPGKTILADCDMSTEDINECSASHLLCPHSNAICINTHGSYYCSCSSGFTGNGEHCSDIDECTSGTHTCLMDTATCTNTIGSYNCSCKAGYLGDGNTSCVAAPECQNYKSLTGGGRKNTYVTTGVHCDSNLGPGWIRFSGAAGKKMPTSCVPINRCNTHSPGWLNGIHPTVADGKVTRQVCFNYFGNCCNWSINIQVRNCGAFFIYYISGTPPEHHCNLRYCASD